MLGGVPDTLAGVVPSGPTVITLTKLLTMLDGTLPEHRRACWFAC
jgi:hypothetical protein